MRIGIIGAGNVGRALDRGWRRAGHSVRLGVPNPADEKHADLGADRLTRPAEATADAAAVVLAVPWTAVEAAIGSLGDLAGRVLIDCTNPLGMGPTGLGLTLGFETSGAERIAGWASGALVVKTLNQTGAENMERAADFPHRPVMFVAADDAAAKSLASGLVQDLGFEAADAGPLRNARLLEPLAMVWIDQVLTRGWDRGFALALARRG